MKKPNYSNLRKEELITLLEQVYLMSSTANREAESVGNAFDDVRYKYARESGFLAGRMNGITAMLESYR
jgi:hypothetical protein